MVEEITVEQRLQKLEQPLLETTRNQNNGDSTMPRLERGVKSSTRSSNNPRKNETISNANVTRGRFISPKKSKAPPKHDEEDQGNEN